MVPQPYPQMAGLVCLSLAMAFGNQTSHRMFSISKIADAFLNQFPSYHWCAGKKFHSCSLAEKQADL